jgi:hypothetical protein
MNKKLWAGFIAVWVVYGFLESIVNTVILKSTYLGANAVNLWRPEGEMRIWIIYIAYLFFAFFFTLVFSKGFENKGIMEGVRYGFYVGMMCMVPAAYVNYATMPMPFMLALQWFIYGLITVIICGIVLSYVFKTRFATVT